ncbi:MAG: hypothetical protein BEN18_04030 [Epulopiscium sp. Nuni2H_MBin001]|nr:MAG: hypothetical protein BEN18_04030 [Epulopiscium sp. Nuni2H_MBin001]
MEKIQKSQLIMFALTIIIIGISYGINPEVYALELYGLQVVGNMVYIFRTLCGVYLGLGIFWIYTAISKQFIWGLVVECFFVGGAILGRLSSILLDGFPNNFFLQFFLFGEVFFLIVALFLLNKARGAK